MKKKINNVVGIDVDKTKNKWITLRLSNEELKVFIDVKDAVNRAGLPLSMSALMRRILSIGIDALPFSLKELEADPLVLYRLGEQ
tara:strand:+ start:781 stop:1035 length:255 start_codon:yes stop_codon:yes gene_type:complete